VADVDVAAADVFLITVATSHRCISDLITGQYQGG